MDDRGQQTYAPVRRDRVAITFAVAVYNEEPYIWQCLTGLLSQCNVPGEIEILVIDGMSTDRTADIVRSFPEYGTKIRLLQNHRRLQVYAWNMALEEARGEYFAMILGHAEYEPGYVEACLEVMKRTGAVAVGGVQRPYGTTPLSRGIAWCMSSALGMGNARFRYTQTERESDTVFSIFARVDSLRAIGGYDESLPFDEDSDLNYRLRRRGGKLVVSPRIRVRYHVRRSLKALWKQMSQYGYWRRFTQLKHPAAVPWRVFAPAALVAGLALSALLVCTPMRGAALLLPALYCAFLIAASAASARTAGVGALFVPAALCTMHVAYGWGWWRAVLYATPRWRRSRASW